MKNRVRRSSDSDFPGFIFIPKSNFSPYEKEEAAPGFEYQSILEYRSEGGAFQIFLLTLRPGANRAQVSTAAFEFIYVLQGNL